MRRARERQLKRHVRAELRAMQITPPLRVDVLCRRLAERRGRRLRLVPFPLSPELPFGLWLGFPEGDFLVFQSETSRPHQDLIILHEVGHILAGHESDERDERVWEEWLELSAQTIRMMRRTHYDQEHEQEAEVTATVIQKWASVLDHSAPRLNAGDPMVQQLQSALGDRQGWL